MPDDIVQRIQGPDAEKLSDAQREQKAAQPGALTERPGDLWQFTGDGKSTAKMAMARVMQLTVPEEDELAEPARNPAAAEALAAHALQMPHNKHLRGHTDTADDAVPEGEPFHMQGGPSLKSLLQMMMSNPEFMQQLVAGTQNQGSVGLAESSNALTGNVRPSMAAMRGIPSDPKV